MRHFYSYNDDSYIEIDHSPMPGMEHMLEPNTTYTATLPAGGIKDISGNPIEDDFSFSFTTIVVDVVRPTVSSTDPANSI